MVAYKGGLSSPAGDTREEARHLVYSISPAVDAHTHYVAKCGDVGEERLAVSTPRHHCHWGHSHVSQWTSRCRRRCLRQQTTSSIYLTQSNRVCRKMALVLAVLLIHYCSYTGAQSSDVGGSPPGALDHTGSRGIVDGQRTQESGSMSSGEDAPSGPHEFDLIPHSPASNKLFWVMRGKKNSVNDVVYPNYALDQDVESDNEESDLKKREITSYSNWGSNPYLLGKRLSNRQAFWTARGKKHANKDHSSNNEIVDFDDNNLSNEGINQYENALNYAIPFLFDTSPNYVNDHEGYTPDVAETQPIPLKYLTDMGEKRGNRLFWASRGKRQDISKTSDIMKDKDMVSVTPNKRGQPVKVSPSVKEVILAGKNADRSKFWMSRGRRFWAARGKKSASDSSNFHRLARLVNSDIKSRQFFPLNSAVGQKSINFYDIDHDPQMLDKPNFWVVRGKKSTVSKGDEYQEDAYDNLEDTDNSLQFQSPLEIRDKKGGFNRLSFLARMNERQPFRNPNFWASRGRKNFWAARGKR